MLKKVNIMLNFTFIGWCKEDTHDKVWGVINLTPKETSEYICDYVIFWGRRGKKLQTKILKNERYWEVERLVDSKQRKGYNKIENLDSVYPEFQSDLEKTAMWSMFKV